MIKRIIAPGVPITIALALAVIAQAQDPISIFDGTTPTSNTPGSPAEAYRLSNIETINVLTGRLNIAIPIGEIPGRGDARAPLVVHLETNWRQVNHPVRYGCTGSYCNIAWSYLVDGSPWTKEEPDYISGVMQMRKSGDYCNNATSSSVSVQYWSNTLTRLTYVAPDGTETEFRDNKTGGLKKPGQVPGGIPPFDRGTVFNAYDGSSAVFVANTNVTDPVGCQNTVDYWDGVLRFRNGTSYTFTYGYVTQIEDRNGNLVTINRNGPITISDSYGRTTQINGDTITFPGQGGSTRTVTIVRDSLGNLLYQPPPPAPTVTTLPTQCQGANCQALFPMVPCGYYSCSTTPYNPAGYVSQIVLPNNQSYQFKYNPWGDVASLTLPTGGRYEYDYVTAVSP